VRIGISPYINARPLTRGLENEPVVELVIASPSRLADLLRAGFLDAALVSSTEYFTGDYLLVGVCSMSAVGSGADAALFGKLPWHQMRRIALDAASRSTNLLLHLLVHHLRPGAAVSFEIRPQDTARSLREFDACLMIGDMALGECGEADYRYDLVDMWREMTNLPMVLTVWLARPDADPRILKILDQAYRRGQAEIEQIIEEAAVCISGGRDLVRWYLTKSLDYKWSKDFEHALSLFGRMLYELGLVEHDHPIRYFGQDYGTETEPIESSQAR